MIAQTVQWIPLIVRSHFHMSLSTASEEYMRVTYRPFELTEQPASNKIFGLRSCPSVVVEVGLHSSVVTEVRATPIVDSRSLAITKMAYWSMIIILLH